MSQDRVSLQFITRNEKNLRANETTNVLYYYYMNTMDIVIMNGGRENITRVVNHWSLPFSLVVRVLDLLHNNTKSVRRESE